MKRKNQIIILALIVVSVGMIVGFSILSKQLKIEGTTTIDSEYDVSITGINKYTFWDNCNFTYGISGYEQSVEIEEATFTSDTATFNVRLNDSSISYAIDITNSGDVAAVIDSININKTSESIDARLLNDIEGVYLAPGQNITLVLDLRKAETVTETGKSTVTVIIETKQHTTEEIKYPTPAIAFLPEFFNYENNSVTIALLPDFISGINAENVLSTKWELYKSVDDGEYELVGSRGPSLMEYQSIDVTYEDLQVIKFKAKVTYPDGSELWSNEITLAT